MIMDQWKFDKAGIEALVAPAKGNFIKYDKGHKDSVTGLGIRVTAGGSKAFILNYRIAGRERRYTIGEFGVWSIKAAREEAARLRRDVDRGIDPMAERVERREAKTVDDLCDRFIADYLPKKRPATQRDYRALIDKEIRPALKHESVAELRHDQIDDLHRKITKRGATYTANRAVAVLSRMLNLAAKWGWRTGDNPAKGVEKNAETKRKRYLTTDERRRLVTALDALADQQSANVIRLLMLTGARSGELLGKSIKVGEDTHGKEGVRWDAFQAVDDVKFAKWLKPGSTTKQKTDHEVWLSAPARDLLQGIRTAAEVKAKKTGEAISDYVFPGHAPAPYQTDVKKSWATVTAADAANLPDLRVHDLRHSYASVLVSAGQSLPIIGALLGHSQTATTARYAHLMDDPLKEAAKLAGEILTSTK